MKKPARGGAALPPGTKKASGVASSGTTFAVFGAVLLTSAIVVLSVNTAMMGRAGLFGSEAKSLGKRRADGPGAQPGQNAAGAAASQSPWRHASARPSVGSELVEPPSQPPAAPAPPSPAAPPAQQAVPESPAPLHLVHVRPPDANKPRGNPSQRPPLPPGKRSFIPSRKALPHDDPNVEIYTDILAPEPRPYDDGTPVPDYLEDVTIITMASGDGAARNAIALIQSLVEVKTRAPIKVLLARGGAGSAACQDKKPWVFKGVTRRVPAGECEYKPWLTEAPDIISPKFLEALERLGATWELIDPLPITEFTAGIPGGQSTFWGMSLNRMRIFNMTHYKKILWMDSDILALHNIDHLFKEPMLTASFTYSCCNPNSPPRISGGMWVVEPSDYWGLEVWRQMNKGKPYYDDKTGTVTYGLWQYSDMDIINEMFANRSNHFVRERFFPQIEDYRQGYVPNIKIFPKYASLTDKEFEHRIKDLSDGQLLPPGVRPEFQNHPEPIWRCLDVRYDQCVGNCECIKGRDIPNDAITVHFSCFWYNEEKPSHYKTEHDLKHAMYHGMEGCLRFWYDKWYETYKRGMNGERFPPPYWEGPPVPIYNETHDQYVMNTARRDSNTDKGE